MSVCPEGCSSEYCLHPNCILALTGFNLGLGHLIERCLVVQAYPFAVDVCLSLGALLLPCNYNNLATEACACFAWCTTHHLLFSHPNREGRDLLKLLKLKVLKSERLKWHSR